VSLVVDGLFLACVLGAFWLFGGRIKAAFLAKECPYCRTWIKKKATRCPTCQKDLPARG
jgi:hypothetical protein